MTFRTSKLFILELNNMLFPRLDKFLLANAGELSKAAATM